MTDIARLRELGAKLRRSCDLDGSNAIADALTELETLRAALAKINVIRNSIVGAQTMNWSEHIYPLVAALNVAGYEGQPYPEARAYIGSVLDQRDAAEARAKHAEAELETAHALRTEAHAAYDKEFRRAEKLRKALKPLALIALERDSVPDGPDHIAGDDLAITPKDVRAARALLTPASPGEDDKVGAM